MKKTARGTKIIHIRGDAERRGLLKSIEWYWNRLPPVFIYLFKFSKVFYCPTSITSSLRDRFIYWFSLLHPFVLEFVSNSTQCWQVNLCLLLWGILFDGSLYLIERYTSHCSVVHKSSDFLQFILQPQIMTGAFRFQT